MPKTADKTEDKQKVRGKVRIIVKKNGADYPVSNRTGD